MRKSLKRLLMIPMAAMTVAAIGVPSEWPLKRAELKPLGEKGTEPVPAKTLTMLVQSGERFGARPSALVLKGEDGERPTRFEIIAHSDQSGSITYRAQKQTPRGVKVLQVEDRPKSERASDQFEWEVTMMDEDGVSQKLGGNPTPAYLPGSELNR